VTTGVAQIRRRSKAVPITVAALLGSGLLAGCGSNDKAYDQVCVDNKTNTRIADARCDENNNANGTTGGAGSSWYYIGRGGPYGPPPIGSPPAGGSRFAPSDGKSFSGVPDTGGTGTVSRGGFGGKSGTVGG
jgi:hypothetical protein